MEDKDRDELLIRIDERLKILSDKIKTVETLANDMKSNCNTNVKSINEDIDSLKMWKNRTVGALAIVGMIISTMVYIIVTLIDKIISTIWG